MAALPSGPPWRVNLDEHPFGTPFDANGRVDPGGEAVDGREMRRRVVERSVLEAGQDPPDPPAHVEGERSLEYQQGVFRGCMA